MLTDRQPRKPTLRAQYCASDKLCDLETPPDDRLRKPAVAVDLAMRSDSSTAVREACAEFLRAASEFYGVSQPQVRVLAARPVRVYEGGGASELFGDYDLRKKAIRVWMRTAVRKQVTSLGTFLSTLCHEFCHHLDVHRLGFGDTPHTRGFYARTAVLYHHARGTPMKQLVWVPLRGGRWRIDWARTNRGDYGVR
ncbi:hypothetical protein SBA2_280007 [Acidobacteriia bacterium SbA2]|nr:hypothetical protein SBA2_280007 [Acidobacteriia bacterium SbA2]